MTTHETVQLHGWVLTQIPSRAIYDDSLSHGAVRLLCAFCFHARLEKEAWPGFEKMVSHIPHMSERTGYRLLDELRAAGYVYRYMTDDKTAAVTHIFVTKEDYDEWMGSEDRPEPTTPTGGSDTGDRGGSDTHDRGGLSPVTEGGLSPMTERGLSPVTDKIDSIEIDSIEVDTEESSSAPDGAEESGEPSSSSDVVASALMKHNRAKELYRKRKQQRRRKRNRYEDSETLFFDSLDEDEEDHEEQLRFTSFPDDKLMKVANATGRTKFHNEKEMRAWLRAIDPARKDKLPLLDAFFDGCVEFAKKHGWSFNKLLGVFGSDNKYEDYLRSYPWMFEEEAKRHGPVSTKTVVGTGGGQSRLAQERASERARHLPPAPGELRLREMQSRGQDRVQHGDGVVR